MKTRLTITLSQSTLDAIDRLIDKKRIRSRSHAIEHLLQKSLQPRLSTALILAGGEKHADQPSRPLTLLNDKPLIVHTIEHLQKFGVTKIVIATNESGKDIQTLLGEGKSLGVEIKYVFEASPAGTAGAILSAQKYLSDGPFFVIAGDVLTTIDLEAMAEFHTQQGGLLTMAVKPRSTLSTYDNVFIEGHTVVDFQRSTPEQTVSIVNAGVYLFEPEVLEWIPKKSPAMLESDVFPQLAKSQKLLAFPFQGIWFDITSDQNYQAALQQLGY
ncbi:NTP transferase domain-containing protein [Candidatus Woesebacteria bacterium]|nr:NTP transferase domain-containing protein [Candidatus Woesebacteria bacterium]MCD8507148.1 NTP transferase domain-containing protein [Candidatus Woesebacteria bacterium]MCD8527188.1 NTP transferase domain-containing protein [Candidatus Woesebacteria bacterium]MCD8545958.1 NTP transferase domain-containing protein [Candidatus Woesebacteria bacterium]